MFIFDAQPQYFRRHAQCSLALGVWGLGQKYYGFCSCQRLPEKRRGGLTPINYDPINYFEVAPPKIT